MTQQGSVRQLSFAEFGVDSRQTDRLVFMALPDEPAARQISVVAHELKRKHKLRGRPLSRMRLHISLLHIRDYYKLPNDVVVGAKNAANKIVFPPVEIALNRVMSFSGSYAQVLLVSEGGAELAELRVALASALERAGVKSSCRTRFKPHLTLLYDEHLQIEEDIEPIRWTVNEFVLIDSLLGQTRYKTLGRWSLAGRRPPRSTGGMGNTQMAS